MPKPEVSRAEYATMNSMATAIPAQIRRFFQRLLLGVPAFIVPGIDPRAAQSPTHERISAVMSRRPDKNSIFPPVSVPTK